MQLKHFLTQLKATTWWTEECPAVAQPLFPVLEGFANIGKHIGLPKLHSVAMFIWRDNFIVEKTPSKEKELMFERLIKIAKTDRKKFKEIEKEWTTAIQDALNCIPKNLASFSKKELIALYQKFFRAQAKFWEYGLIAEAPDPFSNENSEEFAHKIFGKNYHDRFRIAIAAEKMSFLDRQTLNLLKLTEDFMLLGKPDGSVLPSGFKKKLALHTKKFFWVHLNYKKHTLRNETFFLREIQEEAEKQTLSQIQERIQKIERYYTEISTKKKELFKITKITSEEKATLKVLQWCGEILDTRKENALKIMHHLYRLLKVIAEKTITPYDEVLSMTPEGIQKVLSGKKVVTKNKNVRAAYITISGKLHLFYGEDADAIYGAVTAKQADKSIKGIVVSLGKEKKVEGVCQIILDVHKEAFKDGNILVTSMTRPEFVPLMKKAKAIITDEGGLTSHAAIVSRELGIPCIVGTRTATKLLSSGKKVLMNCTDGTVKALGA